MLKNCIKNTLKRRHDLQTLYQIANLTGPRHENLVSEYQNYIEHCRAGSNPCNITIHIVFISRHKLLPLHFHTYTHINKMPVTLPLKFNAGKVLYDEDTNECTPAQTPGEIIIEHSPEGEGCYSFTWRPRGKDQNVEGDELFVFQGDVVWKKINSCKSGRVYMFAFLSSGAKHFFWMQDPNGFATEDTDDEALLSKDSPRDLELAAMIKEVFSDGQDE